MLYSLTDSQLRPQVAIGLGEPMTRTRLGTLWLFNLRDQPAVPHNY